jgi:hypothetical protein
VEEVRPPAAGAAEAATDAGVLRQHGAAARGEALAEVKKLGMKVNEIDLVLQEGGARRAGRAREGVRRRGLLAQIRKQ